MYACLHLRRALLWQHVSSVTWTASSSGWNGRYLQFADYFASGIYTHRWVDPAAHKDHNRPSPKPETLTEL